jgi:hypothetical protein
MEYNINVLRIADSDRNLVLFTDAYGRLKGVNFWHGLGDDALMKDFLQPDPAVTDWVLKRLRLANEEWVEYDIVCPTYHELIENINTAISGYIQHRDTPQQITLPSGQIARLKDALALMAQKAKDEGDSHAYFDAITLRAILNYPTSISITSDQQQNFCAAHGVDFPEFVTHKF